MRSVQVSRLEIMEASATVNTGNFTVVVKGTLLDTVVQKKVSEGLVYDLQRGGLSKAYIALGGQKNDKGKVKLPDDFKREQVEFNEENQAAMQLAVEEWAKAQFDGAATVTVSKYEGGDAATPMKRATALVDSFIGTDAETAYRGILGLPDGDRDALITEANKRGLGIQPPKAASE